MVPRTRTWLGFILGYFVLMNMLSRGIGETFAVFLLPLADEFNWSCATFTGAYSTHMIGYGLCALFAGVVFSRMGARFTYTSGLIICGVPNGCGARGAVEVFEGAPPRARTVMLEFPSIEKAKTWYNSLEYQSVGGMRHQASEGRGFVVEGLDD